MDIIDLEDYEIHAAITSALNSRVISPIDFAPLIIFLIEWAKLNQFIEQSSFDQIIGEDTYKKLKLGAVTFNEFVLEVMDGVLPSNIFKTEVREFVEEYVEFDGYVKDLTDIFKTNIGDLPRDFSKMEKLNETISYSRENYLNNKTNFPELVSFVDPEKFKKMISGV
ncbi:MAG: hypothetical protein ACI9LX_001260 [Paraglaciecola sp.]